MALNIYAPMPANTTMASSTVDPQEYVFDLDKSHVRIVETFTEITSKVPRNPRRDFQRKHNLDSASPARWDFEHLMLACADFGIHPTLGKAGLEFVTNDLGIDPGAGLKSEYLADKAVNDVEHDAGFDLEDEDGVEEESWSEEIDVSESADSNWFEQFFGLDSQPAPRAGASTPPSSTNGTQPQAPQEEEKAQPSSPIFVPVTKDEHFHIEDATKKLLRTVVGLAKKGAALNVALRGPTGCGKTSLPEWLAAQTGMNLFIFDAPTIRETKDAFGFKELVVDEESGLQKTVWQKSGFVQAISTDNTIVVIDEATRIHASLTNGLLAFLDHRKRVWLDDLQESVQVGDNVLIFVTANIGASYTGTWRWDAAFENRMDYQIDVGYLPVDKEIEVLTKKTGVDAKVAKSFCEIAQIVRQRAQDPSDPLSHAISTRQLLSAARGVVAGLSPSEALEFTIIPTYSSEGGAESDRAHVLQIVQGKLPA